ncbi:Ectonucleoside triphosphate diphosphohydrolase 5 [Gracilariopsis chorda]|uniref:Ectonucleoside triphosphate diphosphohydrolase 5 n=1 Tax=Gracilariopsis chorda TaxID=448386 RepID=A0A2V3J2D9_9FLOR|nr:Ectonucleoside triphosphate diphosphohydrolase 5 [Gracilariopsis chorda]|eukprot:PXF48272.1 Ectonucleoside triphosphate diphosphohydrolase 5 [Gracilariopsis chorda]
MPQNTTRRRRANTSSAASKQTTHSTTTSATSDDSQPTKTPKSVPQLLDEEYSSFKNFLSLAAVACLVFFHMIQNTKLPPPGRVHGVMIDAGSTGTRAQVFTFRFDKEHRHLELQSTAMFAHNKTLDTLASATASSSKLFFKPLLEKVKKAVPGLRRRKRTPIALHATAGFRLLGDEKAERALDMARQALGSTEFMFKSEWVSVLSESDEANHAWVTTNYLLRNFDPENKEKQFVGALELGGASMQIVFHDDGDIDESITTPESEEAEAQKVKENGHFPAAQTPIKVFGQTYTLHSRNHLGLGLVNFKKKLYGIFDHEGVLEEGNPCFRKGTTFKDTKLKVQRPDFTGPKTVRIVGDGDFDRCVASAEIAISSYSRLFDKRSHLPDEKKFVAFAYFYDKTVRLGLNSSATKEEMIAKGKELCEDQGAESHAGLDERCAEFSYIFAVLKILTENFSVSKTNVSFEQFVDGHMLGWPLGAVLDTLQPEVIASQVSLDKEPPLMT